MLSLDSEHITLNGIGISYGLGKTYEESDARLKKDKQRRQQKGYRAAKGHEHPRVFRVRQEPAGKGALDHDQRQENSGGGGRSFEPGQVAPPDTSKVPADMKSAQETEANFSLSGGGNAKANDGRAKMVKMTVKETAHKFSLRQEKFHGRNFSRFPIEKDPVPEMVDADRARGSRLLTGLTGSEVWHALFGISRRSNGRRKKPRA